MIPDKRPMSPSFTIPKHWRRGAYSKGFSIEKIMVMEQDFKRFYSKSHLELTDIAWERRWNNWVDSQRKPLYHQPGLAKPIPPLPESGKRSPFIGLQYLAQMKMMLK